MDKQSIIHYRVFSLDVWGHSPSECTDYECSHCTEECEPEGDGKDHTHDDDKCQCGYEVNDRCCVGVIEVETDEGATYNTNTSGQFESWHCSDGAIVQALIDSGFLKDTVDVSDVEIDGDEEYSLWIDDAKGRGVFQLEFEKAEPKE